MIKIDKSTDIFSIGTLALSIAGVMKDDAYGLYDSDRLSL